MRCFHFDKYRSSVGNIGNVQLMDAIWIFKKMLFCAYKNRIFETIFLIHVKYFEFFKGSILKSHQKYANNNKKNCHLNSM